MGVISCHFICHVFATLDGVLSLKTWQNSGAFFWSTYLPLLMVRNEANTLQIYAVKMAITKAMNFATLLATFLPQVCHF